MTILPWVFLLAAAPLLSGPPHFALDDTIELPHDDWRYVDLKVKDRMAVVNCEYSVVSEKTPVRVVWIGRSDLDGFRNGRHDRALAATSFGMEGKLRHFEPSPGDYALVVENEPGSNSRAKVKLRVWLESAATPTYVPRQRQLAVILISSGVFFGIVTLSAWKLSRARI
jgi:hypothetical protein